ncbi:phage integrase SAM-like domain-containing protein [Spirosoma areae]
MAKTTDYKEGKATVKVVYFTSKTLADGSHPFMVRITKDRVRKYIATGLSLFPKYWNDKYTGYREAIRKSYPEPNRNNLITSLEGWERKFSDSAEKLAIADEVHDAKAVANEANEGRKQARRTKLLAYTDELTAGMKRASQLGNMLIYQSLKNQLADFIRTEYSNTDDVPFSAVTVKFCNDFEVYMREKGNADTTLHNRFRTLRAVLNKAISEGAASLTTYPFARTISDKHKFSVSKFNTTTQKRAINRDDVRKVETFVPVGTAIGQWAGVKNAAEIEGLQLAKNVFLFSFYLGGINFVDLVQLRWHNLSTDADGNKRLTYVRQKTGGKFSVRLLAPVVGIIEQYRPFTHTSPDSYIFPVLNTKIHLTPKSITNRLKKILGQVNADLKLIGNRAGIDMPLTTYVARHSFATSLRRAGVAMGVISASLGHKTEAVTNIYLDSFASETVDAAFDALL